MNVSHARGMQCVWGTAVCRMRRYVPLDASGCVEALLCYSMVLLI